MNRLICALLAVMLVWTTTGCGNGDDPPITSCLAEGTQIATPSGPVRIEKLRVGDQVYSVDPRTGERHPARITAIREDQKPALAIRTRSGRTVIATAEHPFYVRERGEYVPAGELRKQSVKRLALHDGKDDLGADAILALEELPGTFRVFDLTVDSRFHNFLADGFLVHNKSPPPPGIEEAITSVQDDMTLAAAALQQGYPTYDSMGQIVSLAADPFNGNVAVIQVTSAMGTTS